MSKIILASQSPRRRALLSELGVAFDIIPSNYDEKLDESKSAQEVAKLLALGKAQDVAVRYPGAYIIGSDTIVAIGQRQMEKPKNIEEAREMLVALSGGESLVTTGIAIICLQQGIQVVDEVTTAVFFKPDSPQVSVEREKYLQTGDWHDKAGGYGIQSGAAPLIDRIEGDYNAIVGLPTEWLKAMLAELRLL